jgi:hypothetical protein
VLTGTTYRKSKGEVLRSEIARLESERDFYSARAKDLNDELMRIGERISSFLDQCQTKIPSSGGDKLDAVFNAYSMIRDSHVVNESAKARIQKELEASKIACGQLQDTLQKKEKEMKEQEVRMAEESERQLSLKDRELKDLEKKLIIGADFFQPKPDSELTQQFDDLHAKIRTFAEDAGCGWADHASQQAFAENVKRRFRRPIENIHLKYFLEEALWTILIDKVFSTPFTVFGKYGDALVHYWRNFFPEGMLQDAVWSPPSRRRCSQST